MEAKRGSPGVGTAIHDTRSAQLGRIILPGEPSYSFAGAQLDEASGLFTPSKGIVTALHNAGADDTDILRVFRPDGTIIPRSTIPYDINRDRYGRERSPSDVISYLQGLMEEPYRLVNLSLKGEGRHGKNNHDLIHVLQVAMDSDELLNQVGAPYDVRRANAVAANLHDIGDLWGHEYHPYFTEMAWEQFLPNLVMTDTQKRLVKQAFLFHDTDVIAEVFSSWDTRNVPEFIQGIKTYGEPALATTMADKGDISLERLPPEEFPDDIENPHRFINLYGGTEFMRFSEDLTKLSWQINFGDQVPEWALKRFPHFVILREDGKIVRRLPRRYQGKIEERNPDLFDEWHDIYWAMYYPRTMLTVLSAFALNDLLEVVEICMEDKSHPGVGGSFRRYTFPRGEIGARMHRIFERRVPAAKKNTVEFNIFSQLKDAV